jgi:hypothetical protein
VLATAATDDEYAAGRGHGQVPRGKKGAAQTSERAEAVLYRKASPAERGHDDIDTTGDTDTVEKSS